MDFKISDATKAKIEALKEKIAPILNQHCGVKDAFLVLNTIMSEIHLMHEESTHELHKDITFLYNYVEKKVQELQNAKVAKHEAYEERIFELTAVSNKLASKPKYLEAIITKAISTCLNSFF